MSVQDAFAERLEEARKAVAQAVELDFARELAIRTGVSQAEARSTVQAATDILEWRLGCAPPWRVLRLAQAIIEHERRIQGDLFEARR